MPQASRQTSAIKRLYEKFIISGEKRMLKNINIVFLYNFIQFIYTVICRLMQKTDFCLN